MLLALEIILLGAIVGYILGPLVIILAPFFFIGIVLYFFGKAILSGYLERGRGRRKGSMKKHISPY